MPSQTDSSKRINPGRRAKRAPKQKSKPTLIDTLELSPSLRAKSWSPEPSETDEARENDIQEWLLACGINANKGTDDELLCQATGKEVKREPLDDVHVEEQETLVRESDSVKISKELPQAAAADTGPASENPAHLKEQIPSTEVNSVKSPKNRWSKKRRREAKRVRELTLTERPR